MSRIALEHRREGHAYTGRLVYVDGGAMDVLSEFSDFSFARMMARFSGEALARPYAELAMVRTERSDFEPIVLDEATSKKLREDPAVVIKAMTVAFNASDRIEKQLKKSVEDKVGVTDKVNLHLRAGHDTLADAFGDFVYLRLHPHEKDGMRGECPYTGKWLGFGARADDPAQMLLKTGRQNAHADWLPVEIVGGSETENPKWVRVKTDVLLFEHDPRSVGQDNKFFIPRKWNKTSPWISHGALTQMYEEYKKEKEACCSDETKA